MSRGRKISLLLMILLYTVAGVNHFVNPQAYISIIPHYFPRPDLINIAAGIFELILGLLLIPKSTRNVACISIIIMLIAFIPAHIYMIQKAAIHPGIYSIKWWIVLLRLVAGQAVLIWWTTIQLKDKN
jgi:uncharacterized membrane protein